MTESKATGRVSCAIVVFKKNSEVGMRWDFDTRNWCVFGSHKDCDIQIRARGVDALQALVTFHKGRLWLQTLSKNNQTVLPGFGPLKKNSKVPLEDGYHFFLASRLFCAERTVNANSSSSSDGAEVFNRYGKELNRFTRKKSYGLHTSTSGKKARRTSLVVTDTEQILVEATTKTELFPSSVLHTPSMHVYEKLDRVASPFNPVQNFTDQEIEGHKIKLSYPSHENAGTKPTPAVDEGLPTPDNRVCIYSTDEEGHCRVERENSETGAHLPLDNEKEVKPGPPTLFQGMGSNEKLNPPSNRANSLVLQRKTGNEPAPMLDGGREASDREQPALSFSRWPRKKKNAVGTPIQVNNTNGSHQFSKSKSDNVQLPTARPPPETISALSKKQMAYDRLSQGLPATPMKWETGLGSSRVQRRTGNIIRTPNGNSVKHCAVLGSGLRTPSEQKPFVEPGNEKVPAALPRSSDKIGVNMKSKDSNAKDDSSPAKSPGTASFETLLPEGPPDLMPKDQESQNHTTPAGKHTLSDAEGPASSPRRSVLFNDFELGQGPHYSPARIRIRSHLTSKSNSQAESSSLGSHPQPSPSSRSSEEAIPLSRIQGPPPTQKLQELGTFFYPGNSSNLSEPASALSPQKNAEDFPDSRPSPDIKQPNFEYHVAEGTTPVHDEVSSEENSSSSGSIPLCPNELNSLQASSTGIQEQDLLFSAEQPHPAAEKLIPSQEVVASRGDGVHNNVVSAGNPRRRSILGAMLDAARAVTERFSMGRASSSASVDDGPTERIAIDRDPEDLETGSESDDPFDPEDIETWSESSNSDSILSDLPAEMVDIRTGRGQDDDYKHENEAKTPNTETTRGHEMVTGPETSDRPPNNESLEQEDDLEKFRKMKFVGLRRYLKKLGLDTTGKKDMLLQRLGEYLSTERESPGDVGSVEPTLSPQEATVYEQCTSDMQPDEDITLEKVGNGDLGSDEEVAQHENSEITREQYQLRTVKELLGFMKDHDLPVPQRIKKADLIDLVIDNGIDSDGHLIASQHCSRAEEEQSMSIPVRSTPSSTTIRTRGDFTSTGAEDSRGNTKSSVTFRYAEEAPQIQIGITTAGTQKSRVNQKEVEATQATPVRRSARRKGKAEPSTGSKEAGPDMGSALKVRQSNSKKPSAAAIEEAKSVPATPLRSARKRKPVKRFEG